MTKEQIEKYMTSKGVSLNSRVEIPNGGQYLSNFLFEFSKNVIEELITEQICELKEMRVINRDRQITDKK